MDPLSEVLSLVKARSYSAGGLDFGGDWAVRFRRYEGIKCYAVASGQCWLSVEGNPDVLLQPGDCFLLTGGHPFSLASDLAVTPVDFMETISVPPKNGIFEINGGGGCFIGGGHFILSGNHTDILLSVLAPIVHLHTESDKAELRWYLEHMRQELREPRPGAMLVAQHFAHMMLIQVLRQHLAEGVKDGAAAGRSPSWLFSLADKQMSAAISAMHDDPAHPWTLQTLAAHAGMSRSLFARRFKETVGESPMEYLTRWRMMLAGDRLQDPHDSVSAIALAVGYDSESAFGKAFKRVMGCSPRQYSRGQRPAFLIERATSNVEQLEAIAS